MDTNNIFNELLKMKDEGTYRRLVKQPKPYDYIGIKLGDLRAYATQLPKDHNLAIALFDLPYYETMLLSTTLINPKRVDSNLILSWCKKASSSSIIDQGISNFFFDIPDYSTILNSLSSSLDSDLEYAFFALLSSYFRTEPLDTIDIKNSIAWLNRIKTTITTKPLVIQNAMNNAVVMAGLHVPDLVLLAREVADHIGYVMPLVAKNSCNIQSATDYLIRYCDNPKYSRVAKINQSK